MPEPEPERASVTAPLVATIRRLHWQAVLPLAAALGLGLGFVWILRLIARPLALLVVAITVAEALAPIVDRIEERVRHRILAIAVVYLAIGCILVGVGWAIVPTLVAQGGELVDRVPALVTKLEGWLGRFGIDAQGGFSNLTGFLAGRVGGAVVSLPKAIFDTLLDIFVVVFLSIYWLLGSRSLRRFLLSLLPVEKRAGTARALSHMGASMGGYVRGAVINAVIMGILAWAGLTLIGMPFPLVLGVLTMFGEIVPVIGPVVVGTIVAALALLKSAREALLAVALFTALEQIEGHLLTPNIMRTQTHAPQTLVLFAIVVGAALGGFLGILVSIPIAAALRVLVLEVLAPAERRAEGLGEEPADA